MSSLPLPEEEAASMVIPPGYYWKSVLLSNPTGPNGERDTMARVTYMAVKIPECSPCHTQYGFVREIEG